MLKVQLETSWMYSIAIRLKWINSGLLYNHLYTWFKKFWVNHLCQKLCKKNLEANVIQLKKVFGFFVENSSSQPQILLQIECLTNLKTAIKILTEIEFPLIISVMGTHACYHHVVVVWRGMVIDYESEYTFSLTNDSLRQICGVNTSFAGISCGYGIFPPKYIKNSMENSSIEDWGINEYNIKGSTIRKYFKW